MNLSQNLCSIKRIKGSSLFHLKRRCTQILLIFFSLDFTSDIYLTEGVWSCGRVHIQSLLLSLVFEWYMAMCFYRRWSQTLAWIQLMVEEESWLAGPAVNLTIPVIKIELPWLAKFKLCCRLQVMVNEQLLGTLITYWLQVFLCLRIDVKLSLNSRVMCFCQSQGCNQGTVAVAYAPASGGHKDSRILFI